MVGYTQAENEINDRIGRLAARLAALDGQAEDGLHPAVRESEASAAVVTAAVEQLPYTRAGRALLAAATGGAAGTG